MESLSLEILAILAVVGFFAGLIDAMAGGGGLLALPALLWAGLSPLDALGTNKGQGVFGTFAATVNFVRRGEIGLRELLPAISLTFAGSALGAMVVSQVASDLLARIIPFLLIGFAVYFLFAPSFGERDARRRLGQWAFSLLIGFGVGFYDGFFGPGTGTFFVAAFVLLLGCNLKRATAGTKVLNFTSNLAAVMLFAVAGHVLWVPALAMGGSQLLGGWLGSHLVMEHGTRLIRPLLVAVTIILSLRLLFSG